MKTKFFRVARSGKTIDGREITRDQIDQMAKNYDPQKYGARVWLEHLRSVLPDSSFKAYGDVLALKAEDDADGNRVLLAQIDATSDLVELNRKRQKVFSSIEIVPNFDGTGEAYMAGLAVTDSPASLGTDMLKFAIQKSQAQNLFSEAIEATDGLTEEKPDLFSRVKALLLGQRDTADAKFNQVEQSTLAIAAEISGLKSDLQNAPDRADFDALKLNVEDLTAALAKITTSLSGEPQTPERGKSSGQSNGSLTDC
ncbi:GPO family capsid scaffolding protein [Thalassospira marina]|uniref:Phage capsid protein n=1 Tax=Thalassospira marina TaxID=2048283 RepID=A0A2N3KWU4_9PROT|nr:GPO family capsid scaffolding protein [Thalassospira marina]PKR55042.1 phage capsid protein [Thalassospira marina]